LTEEAQQGTKDGIQTGMSFRTDNSITDTANSERLLELLDGLPLANVNAAGS
jgi:hypothetical protein